MKSTPIRPVLSTCCAALAASGFLALAGCAGLSSSIAPDPGVLRVGVTANSPPMIFKQGKAYAGLEADFARALAEELGRKAVFVNLPWERLISGLEEGKVDVVMSNLSVTRPRATRVDFADPYLQVGQMALIHRSDAREFPFGQAVLYTSKKIGVEEGTTGDLFVQARCSKAERKPFNSPEDAVHALLGDHIDVFLHDAPVVWRLAAVHEADGLVALAPALTTENLAWAFPRGQREMRDAANAALAEWTKNGRLHRMIKVWLPAIDR